MNAGLIAELRDISLAADYYDSDRMASQFRAAADAISIFPEEITVDKIPGRDGRPPLPGIGSRMIDAISAWLERGDASPNRKMSELRKSDLFLSYKSLLPLLGIGPVSARRFVEEGVRKVEDLPTHRLNRVQKLGVEWREDLAARIPREEITAWAARAEREYHRRAGETDLFQIVGSYRRGAETSGDIDVLVSGQESHLLDFAKWCEEQSGFIAIVSAGPVRISFLARLQSGGRVRQVDLLYSPPDERALAQLYFTGSALFNISMRRIAKMSGLLLNQKYLGPADGSAPLPCPDEQSIFRHLNLEWVAPEKRDAPITDQKD